MHENTPCFFLFFPLLKSLGGALPPAPHGAAPDVAINEFKTANSFNLESLLRA